jgi:DNA repair exonuclease SbcCD ATPase subunit
MIVVAGVGVYARGAPSGYSAVMRVARLELTGIGPFEAAVFAIPEPAKGTGELVLFEGPNGSGKTTIAHAIACALDPALYQEKSALHAPLDDLARRVRTENGAQVKTTMEEAGATLTAEAARTGLLGRGGSAVDRSCARGLAQAGSARL